MKQLRILLIFLLPVFIHCQPASNNELTLYNHNYTVSGGDSNQVNCYATFYDPKKEKLAVLPKGYEVLIDTTATFINDPGGFPSYRQDFPKDQFTGQHKWIIKKGDQVVAEVPFVFITFQTTPWPGEIAIGDDAFKMRIVGLPNRTELDCGFFKTDTLPDGDLSNTSKKFTYKIKDNIITIPQRDINSLESAVYYVGISYIQPVPIRIDGRKKGMLHVLYTIAPGKVVVRH